MHPILRSFSAILLDLNGTFMFGHDRFGADQDYHTTYRSLGGRRLGRAQLDAVVNAAVAGLDHCYRNTSYYERFPSVTCVLANLAEAENLPAEELELVENVIAAHEAGTVDESHSAVIRELSVTHRLALVSNIWSKKQRYVRELERAGVLSLFEAVVFSSDGQCMKPSRVLFDHAISMLAVSPEQAVVIGDSLRCDVGGAAASGLASVWVDADGKGIQAEGPVPTWIIRDLHDLDPRTAAPV